MAVTRGTNGGDMKQLSIDYLASHYARPFDLTNPEPSAEQEEGMKVVETVHEPGFDCAFGLLHGWVCTTHSREEVERVLLSYPAGTRHGWRISQGPVPCEERKGYQHYIISC